MPSILHSETHSNSVLFWSFKFILKIILLLYFALQTFISLLRKSYENLTQVFSPVSWQIDHALFIHSFIHSFIYSSTAGVELRTNYHADLTSPIKVSSNTSSCRWKQPRTYPPPTSGPLHLLFPLPKWPLPEWTPCRYPRDSYLLSRINPNLKIGFPLVQRDTPFPSLRVLPLENL